MKCFSDDMLAAYVDDELKATAKKAVKSHLAECVVCSKRVKEIQMIDRLILLFLERQRSAQKAEETMIGSTVDESPIELISRWFLDVQCEAIDGCVVEQDGICPHGHPSLLVYFGLI